MSLAPLTASLERYGIAGYDMSVTNLSVENGDEKKKPKKDKNDEIPTSMNH